MIDSTAPFEHRLKVRYGETDQMGVVHHANHLLYLEEARTEWMAAIGCPYGAVEASGIGLPVRRVDLRYRSPAFYEDELGVTVRIDRMSAATVTFGYRIRRLGTEETVLTGTVELACISLDDRRPRMLPDDLRKRLSGAG